MRLCSLRRELSQFVADAPVTNLENVLHKFLHQVLQVLSNSLTQLWELKANCSVRPNCSHLASHTKGKMVHAESQLHQHILGKELRPSQYHHAAPRTEIRDCCLTEWLTSRHLDGRRTCAFKTGRLPSLPRPSE